MAKVTLITGFSMEMKEKSCLLEAEAGESKITQLP